MYDVDAARAICAALELKDELVNTDCLWWHAAWYVRNMGEVNALIAQGKYQDAGDHLECAAQYVFAYADYAKGAA